MHLLAQAILAGVFFGIWPLFMNKSGLNGNISSAVFCIGVFMMLLPFAISGNGLTIPDANWKMVVPAVIFGAFGLMAFNGMLAGATAVNVGALFATMSVTQIVVAAGYQAIMSGSLSLTKGVGFAAAVLAAFLLNL